MEHEKDTREQPAKTSFFKKPWVHSLISAVVIFGLLGAFLFWQLTRGKVSVDDAYLDAPVIQLSPTLPGTLNDLYVKEGDRVQPNSQVALVGSQVIYTKTGGIVASAPETIGAYFSPGQTVASIVNDQEMRVVGQVEETKGLSDIQPGQRVTFIVDAFPGRTYEGIVDQISPISNDNGVVFSISDKRPVREFNVKVRFDVSRYSELKSGMSAKLTIYSR